MSKQSSVILAVIVTIALVGVLFLVSCAKIPENSTNTTEPLADRVTAVETTIAQMSLNSEGVTLAQLKQLEANLQRQLDTLQARIAALENEEN